MVGPLSIFKSSDLTWQGSFLTNPKERLTYAASNPGVFTDLRCYLDWVAKQYGMKMPATFTKPSACGVSHGDRDDINKEVCKGRMLKGGSSVVKDCDFTFQGATAGFPSMKYDTCKPYKYLFLEKDETLPQNTNSYHYYCADKNGDLLNCANNCKGVEPNSMAFGGAAFLTASAIGGISTLSGAVGAGGLAVIGGGFVANAMCLPWQCRARSGSCCLLQAGSRGRVVCPLTC